MYKSSTNTSHHFENASVMNKLHITAQKSPVKNQHAATITRNMKKTVFVKTNIPRTKYTIMNTPVVNCSMHAEVAVLKQLLSCVLKPRKRRYCVL